MSDRPARGYQVQITSWDGDADNYATKTISGLSEYDARFIVNLANSFKAHGPFSERKMKNFVHAYKQAIEIFPNVSECWVYPDPLPSDELCDLHDEYHDLRYKDPEKELSKYDPVRDYRTCSASLFSDWWGEVVVDALVGYSSQYSDFLNYVRRQDGIKVFFVAGIEDETHLFC